VLAEELGRVLAPLPFASSVYLATEALLAAGSETDKQDLLPKLADGSVIGTFALAEGPGQLDPVTIRLHAAGGKLTGGEMAGGRRYGRRFRHCRGAR
jgi:acyl-CoA dehydrogenase